MFAINTESLPISNSNIKKTAKPKTTHKIYPISNQSNDSIIAHNALHIDSILENEKQKNKTDTWNKLDKTIKIEKLKTFAYKFGKDHGFHDDDISVLMLFFCECLDKNKLQKKKI